LGGEYARARNTRPYIAVAKAQFKASTRIASGGAKIIARLGFDHLAAAAPGSEA